MTTTTTTPRNSHHHHHPVLNNAYDAFCRLFTSPHLVSLTERIQVGGRPVAEALLVRHFWECWDALRAAGILFDHPDFPSFFTFFTLVALRIFLEQVIDAFLTTTTTAATAIFRVCERESVCADS